VTEPNFYRDPNVIKDPRSYFDTMRAKCPVIREPHHGTLMVTGFNEAMQVLGNKEGVFSSVCSIVGPIPPLPFNPVPRDIRSQLEEHRADLPWSEHLVCYDGKQHADYRSLLLNLLTPRRVRQNEEYLTGLADQFIDAFIQRGHCNIVPEYAHATTTYAISDIMGIPIDDRAELLELIGAPPSQVGGDAIHKIGADPLIFLKERFDRYLKDRLDAPTSDLMSELVHARFKDGSKPDFDKLSALARFLFAAAQDTTSRLIAMAILILSENPELQQRLRREPKRIGDFLEETLRFDAPVKVAYRLAVIDTRIGQIDVPAGTIVTVCLTGASNDSRHFENPGSFDIDRQNVRDHMGFSKGVHACLGAPLGRMEARIAIERLLVRTSDLRISEQHHGAPGARRYRYEPTYTFRSLSDLYIELSAA
jgi:cytochrome P450